jgi:hypothetical protein
VEQGDIDSAESEQAEHDQRDAALISEA